MWIILGMFAKLKKKEIIRFVFVCLYAHMEQLESHWKDFHVIWYLSVFRKICRKNSNLIDILQE